MFRVIFHYRVQPLMSRSVPLNTVDKLCVHAHHALWMKVHYGVKKEQARMEEFPADRKLSDGGAVGLVDKV